MKSTLISVLVQNLCLKFNLLSDTLWLVLRCHPHEDLLQHAAPVRTQRFWLH